jgi:DNA repair exonuclease SbcCD ATPase subunit
MARTNNKKSGLSVSLFPFLSILACVMGTLTLIIYGVALGQTPPGPSAEDYQEIIDKATRIKEEIESLKAMIMRASERERQLIELRDEIVRLEASLPGTLEQMKLAATLIGPYEELKEQVTSMEEQLGQSGPQLSRLKDQIEATQEELDKIMHATRQTHDRTEAGLIEE